MNQNIRYQFWIIAAAGIIFFTNLGAASLWDEDETLYASCAREMMQRGDWVVPMFNAQMFPDKPPLMFWLMIAGFKIFGLNEFGARFFSALLGVGTALLTYHLGRILFNPKVGLWSGLITASSIIFTVSARAATIDSALVFVTTLAMLCFVIWIRVQEARHSCLEQGSGFRKQWAVDGGQRSVGTAKPQAVSIVDSSFILHHSSFISHPSSIIHHLFSYGLFVLFYICLGLAVLGKGPVGFLLPMASVGLFLMIVNSRQKADEPTIASAATGWEKKWQLILRTFYPMNFLKSLWQLRPITGVVVVLAVALPWYILVGQRTDGLWIRQFFAKYNMRPFMEPILGHSGPMWYYIPMVLIGFFPWSVFLGPAAIDVVRRIREGDPRRDGHVFIACWFGMFFVFWSMCSTKLPHYVLPAYPALALLTGCFLDAWITQPARIGPSWMKNAWITTIAVGVCITVAAGVAAWIYLPGEELIGLVGLIAIAGGYLCLYYSKRRHCQRAATVFACMAVIFLTAIFGFAAQRVDRHQNAKRLLAQIRDDSREPAPVCAYRFFRQSMVFYAGHRVDHCDTPEQLQAFIEQSPKTYLITLDEYEAEIERKHPGQFRLLTREPRFLAADQMVVLVHDGQAESSQTATRQAIGNRE